MTKQRNVVFYLNEPLVAVKCFTHPDLGNVHIGEVLVSQATVLVRNEKDQIPVLKNNKPALIEANLVRKQIRR